MMMEDDPSMWSIPSLPLTILDSFQKWLIPSFSRCREEKKRSENEIGEIYFPFFRERESFVFPNILEIARETRESATTSFDNFLLNVAYEAEKCTTSAKISG